FYEQALQARRQQYTSVPPDDMLLETQIQALLWCEVGSTWYHLGNNVQAQQYYKQSEQVLREANITTGSAWAYLLYNESHLIWRVGNYEEARQIALEALKLFENALHLQDETAQPPSLTRIRRILAGDSVNIGKLYVLLGIIDVSIGQYKEALYHMNEALTLHEKNDSLREIAIVCCDLGNAHLQRAEYSAAQAFLRRCLNLAEQVGEKMLVSFAFGNLGILDLRMGNLVEAEAELRSTIIQAEHINDLASVSGWGAYLAIALQEQYKISDAGMNLHRALTIGRTKNMTPYTGRALVSLGSMRVAQAASMEIEQENSTDSHESISQTLRKAKKTLQHALSLEGLEAETITEGKVILSQVLLLLGEFDNALNQAIQALEDAQRFEQIWLEAGAKRVLGNILMAQGKYEQATSYFDQALRTFRKIDMPLEQAYTLQQYGQALLQQDAITGKEQQKGLSYLQDALQIFTECKAELGMRMVERVLARYEQVSRI